MKRMALIAAFGMLIPLQLGGCPHHHHRASPAPAPWAPPGQVQKKTGYNPASGKVKPGKGKGKP